MIELVAPLVGARIEISHLEMVAFPIPSLPLWERGLKLQLKGKSNVLEVAPLVGARIEISHKCQNCQTEYSRSPCGSED